MHIKTPFNNALYLSSLSSNLRMVDWFLALLAPLTVPALSIYFAARQLFWGKDKEDELDTLKVVRLFEHLGEICLFSVSVS